MSRVRADDPQPLDLSAEDAFDDLVIGQTILGGDDGRVDAQDAGDLFAMPGIFKVVSAEQIRRVAEQPRAHRVALASDAVGSGAGATDVAGHQR